MDVVKKFKAHMCDGCGQTTDYLISLDRASALIVLAIYSAVQIKNENRVHLTNDMECLQGDFTDQIAMALNGKMTSNMADNVLRPKYHGLVAQVDGGGAGEYLITSKGARFLRNEPVIHSAVIDKRTHTKKCYLDESDMVRFQQLLALDQMYGWKLDLEWTERISPIQMSMTPAML